MVTLTLSTCKSETEAYIHMHTRDRKAIKTHIFISRLFNTNSLVTTLFKDHIPFQNRTGCNRSSRIPFLTSHFHWPRITQTLMQRCIRIILTLGALHTTVRMKSCITVTLNEPSAMEEPSIHPSMNDNRFRFNNRIKFSSATLFWVFHKNCHLAYHYVVIQDKTRIYCTAVSMYNTLFECLGRFNVYHAQVLYSDWQCLI